MPWNDCILRKEKEKKRSWCEPNDLQKSFLINILWLQILDQDICLCDIQEANLNISETLELLSFLLLLLLITFDPILNRAWLYYSFLLWANDSYIPKKNLRAEPFYLSSRLVPCQRNIRQASPSNGGRVDEGNLYREQLKGQLKLLPASPGTVPYFVSW